MIAKISKGTHLKSLVEYNDKKIKEGVDGAYLFSSNIRNPTKKNIINELYALNGLSKRKDKNFHASLNFLEKDWASIDDLQRKTLIKDYLKGIGFPEDHKYAAYFHGDKKHPHIHIVTSNILENGKALNDKYIHYKNKELCRKIEKEYNLTPVDEQYNILKSEKKSDNTLKDLEDLEKYLISIKKDYKNKKLSQKDLISLSAAAINNVLRPTDFSKYEKYLLNYGNIKVEKTKKHLNGLYYYYSDNPKKEGFKNKGIKSSSVSSKLTWRNINNNFKYNKEHTKEYNLYVAKQIDLIFLKYDKISVLDFEKELKKKNIFLNINETNNVVRGFSYDHYGYNFKGQDLPKRKYTFGNIKDKFDNESKISDKYLALTKYSYNKNRLNHSNLALFIKDLKSLNLYPIINNEGINLIDTKTYNNAEFLNIERDTFKLDFFNSVLSNLSDDEISELNKYVKEYFNEDLEYTQDVENEYRVDYIEEFNDILGGNYTQDVNEDNSQGKKKGKKKKRIKRKR